MPTNMKIQATSKRMCPTIIFILILVSPSCAVPGPSSLSSTTPISNIALPRKTNFRDRLCTTDNDCEANGVCINQRSKKYCSIDNSTCVCARACDKAEDCPGFKCASFNEGKDYPSICFTCGSDNVTNVIPGHGCPTQSCYASGCNTGDVCVERDRGHSTACRQWNNACLCSRLCDGSGICNKLGGQCAFSTIDGVKSLQICFGCESDSLTVLEGSACGSPKPTNPPSTPSVMGNHSNRDTPIALIVGISLTIVSVIIAIAGLLIWKTRNNANQRNEDNTVNKVFIFQNIYFFPRK